MDHHEEFTRSHPIEGRGLRAGLFQGLLRSGSSSANIAIPDTVVFEHGYPRWWYQYDAKSQEVRRTAGGKDLHAGNIHAYFTEHAPRVNGRKLDHVASYTYAAGEINADGSVDGGSVSVEYFDSEALHQFLFKANDQRKKHGILQGITLPLELCYTVVSIMWCPQVQIVRRRASRRLISDQRSSAADRFVTFDGPDHYSREVNCAEQTKIKVTAACRCIAEHMNRSAHLKVSSMQMFFIIGKHDAAPVLLWCGSMFLVNPNRVTPQPAIPKTLMYMPSFVYLDGHEHSQRDSQLSDTVLRRADIAQRDIKASMSPNQTHRPHLLTSSATEGSSLLPLGDSEGSSAGSPAAAAARQRKQRADASLFIAEHIYGAWYSVSDNVASEYARLLDDERTAILLVSDILYSAHSTFMSDSKARQYARRDVLASTEEEKGKHDPTVAIEVPFELIRCLGTVETVHRMLTDIGLHLEPDSMQVVLQSPRERLTRAVDLHPVSKLIADGERWIAKHFADKQRQLRVECFPAIEDAIARAVVLHFIGCQPLETACAL